MEPRIAIGITTFLRDSLLKECLKSVMYNVPKNTIIMVADQGHVTEEKTKWMSAHPNIQYYQLPFDCGLSEARNFLVKQAKDLGCETIVISADSILFNDSMKNLNILARCIEDNEFDLIGMDLENRIPWEAWIDLIPGECFELDYLRKKDGTFNRIPDYVPYVRANGQCVIYPVELVKNFFVARVDSLLDSPWDKELKTCFHPDTPILIKNGYNRIKSVCIKSLFPKSVKQNSYYGYKSGKVKVWTAEGWKPLKAISRKFTSEKMLHIYTNCGKISLTQNHKLIIDNKEVFAKDLQVGDHIDLCSYPKLTNNLRVDKDWAWLLGFFLAEGTTKRNKAYRIEFANQDIRTLKKCEKILNKFGISASWYINKKRKDKCYFLRVSDAKLLQNYFDEFYDKGEKNIPYYIYDFDKNSRHYFLEGFHEGDGFKSFKYPISICQKYPNVINGLIFLLSSSFVSYKIRELSNKYGNWYTLNLKTKFKEKNPNSIVKIVSEKFETFVYDIECEDHIFCAGIGNIKVHNCEHEDFFWRFKKAEKRVGWTEFCSGEYKDDKPAEYKRYRSRMYSEFQTILKAKYGIKSWIRYKNYR